MECESSAIGVPFMPFCLYFKSFVLDFVSQMTVKFGLLAQHISSAFSLFLSLLSPHLLVENGIRFHVMPKSSAELHKSEDKKLGSIFFVTKTHQFLEETSYER